MKKKRSTTTSKVPMVRTPAAPFPSYADFKSGKSGEVEETSSTMIAAAFQQTIWSGPLPPPTVLIGYKEVDHGFPERILALAERQSEHRQKLETLSVSRRLGDARLGLYFAFSLALTIIGVGGVLAWSGKETTGLATILSALASLVGAFIYRQHLEHGKERESLGPSRTPGENPLITSSKSKG